MNPAWGHAPRVRAAECGRGTPSVQRHGPIGNVPSVNDGVSMITKASTPANRSFRSVVQPRRVLRWVSLAAALAAGVSVGTTAGAAQPTEWVKGRLIVHARAGLSDGDLGGIVKPHGGKARRIGGTNLFVVDLPAGASEVAIASQLARHPHLKFAELDPILKPAMTTTDPYLGSEWHAGKINAPLAWDKTMGSGVTIAILDTGVDGTHPDLAANMVAGWNAYDNNSNAADVTGHGTAVAGTAAAISNNATGVAGVAGAAKIMPIRISDPNGYATGSAVAQGLTFAADNGAKVANISFEGLVGNSTVDAAAQYMKSKGGLVVVAAGNTGTNTGQAADSNLIPVSATESTDVIATWSSYGSFVAVAAPGNYIWTTMKGGGYGQWYGTSFASPVVAGTVALMRSARPDLSNSQIESLLYASAVDLGTTGKDVYYGYGRVDANAAVAAAVAAPAADTQAPTVAISTPAGGATVSGTVAIDVAASDNVGVTRVDLKVNGTLLASDVGAPFQFSWDSTKVANGTASLVAVAYDAAGNSKSSTAVSVSVANPVVADTTPPSVSIKNPANGSKVSGTVQIGVSASDDSGATGLTQSLYVDGALVASSTGSSSLSYNWNTRKAKTGSHSITAIATDAAGNRSTATVSVTN